MLRSVGKCLHFSLIRFRCFWPFPLASLHAMRPCNRSIRCIPFPRVCMQIVSKDRGSEKYRNVVDVNSQLSIVNRPDSPTERRKCPRIQCDSVAFSFLFPVRSMHFSSLKLILIPVAAAAAVANCSIVSRFGFSMSGLGEYLHHQTEFILNYLLIRKCSVNSAPSTK